MSISTTSVGGDEASESPEARAPAASSQALATAWASSLGSSSAWAAATTFSRSSGKRA